MQVVQGMQARGVPIDGVGIQLHTTLHDSDKVGHLRGRIAFQKLARAIAQWVSSLTKPLCL